MISVDANVLKNEPWPEKTSLLVIPGGADLPYCRELNGSGNRRIKQFVSRGGKYLGFCAGAYYAGTRLEFEVGTSMEVSGKRELAFYPGIVRGTAFKGFQYSSQLGERAAVCTINKALDTADRKEKVTSFTCHYNGGPTFVDAEKYDNVEILSRYVDELDVDSGEAKTNAAVVYCKVNKGKAILFGPHVEFDVLLLKYSIPRKKESIIEALEELCGARDAFLEYCLQKLDMKVNSIDDLKVPKLTPLMLSSLDKNSVSQIMNSLEYESPNVVKGPYYTFHVSNIENHETSQHVKMNEGDAYEDPELAPKQLWVFKNGDVPYPRLTPYFGVTSYYGFLKDELAEDPSLTFGKTLLYGEVLTSTNTILEKNFKILQKLPEGFAAIGTTQITGRGRGGNVWVSPMGTLALSTVVRMTMEEVKYAPVIFTQYLTSMAMVDAVLGYGEGYDAIPMKLKWPNDMYIMKPEFIDSSGRYQVVKHSHEIEPIYAKIGGLLINTVVQDGKYVLVIGCGMNVSNAGPTTSLNLVIKKLNEVRAQRGLKPLHLISVERLAARYLTCLEKLFRVFKRNGFGPLLPKYYKHWLHSDQIVTLGLMGDAKARVKGISGNYGYMLVEEVDENGDLTGKRYELQPDGNSFDMMRGLITKKYQ